MIDTYVQELITEVKFDNFRMRTQMPKTNLWESMYEITIITDQKPKDPYALKCFSKALYY